MHTVATCIVATDTKIYFTKVYNVFAFQKLLTSHISVLIRFHKSKSFFWNTKNTERNGVTELNTYHTERQITLERVS